MTSRPKFLVAATAAAATVLTTGIPQRLWAKGPTNTKSPQAALAALMAGNKRFAAGTTVHVDHTERRETLAAGQAPFAIVLSCADSRVVPEIAFDQSLGDVFVVRLAGNYAENDGIGSMQYAVAHFHSSILMVLGHTSCGAVHATVDNLKAGSPPVPGDIQDVVTAIAPAAKAVLDKPGDVYANTTAENVRANVAKLKGTTTIIGEAVKAGTLEIVGAIYDLKTGRVTLI